MIATISDGFEDANASRVPEPLSPETKKPPAGGFLQIGDLERRIP
jgi:hypothetical protein